MAFDLKRWHSDVRAWWAEHTPDLKTTSIESVYALLATSGLQEKELPPREYCEGS
jgi:hypothetical protein